jgi:hypothetical protein
MRLASAHLLTPLFSSYLQICGIYPLPNDFKSSTLGIYIVPCVDMVHGIMDWY